MVLFLGSRKVTSVNLFLIPDGTEDGGYSAEESFLTLRLNQRREVAERCVLGKRQTPAPYPQDMGPT